MGLCHSTEEDNQEHRRSNEIDRLIEKERNRREKEFKILLLGSGESGKSTILKQMKIINLNGYSQDELFTWRSTVYRNVVESAQTIIQAFAESGLSFQTPELNDYIDRMLAYRVSGNPKSQLSPEVVAFVKLLWKDPVVRSSFEKLEKKYYIMDSAAYFFDSIERIGQASYLPNEQDVLRARLKTTGITEIQFQLGSLMIHMFDVGGQRSERKKWIHCFDSVTSVIFCVALSEYDQVLLEESNQNRMMESLALFESIVNSRWFIHSSIMLFLNKVDIFKAKIAGSPLEKFFPDYGGGNDANKAAKYILWRFLQCNRNKLNIYPHLTQATDTSNIRFVFAAVRETLLQNALRDSGML
ncbi:guanine nucleotide-binding protein alpha-3 subunit [Gilbertella persicaria]|uniref:guanine nucleotide-binding protein alpha-3 subunit n=1 Tax=Gilbertella persicaria TaxID=101096 RepID=UPI0022211B98|nr:guanine nucleotide-binding protein alpha-3 subunit [Gilbertella persicaria]KAI8051893.1 guanine nucleotide-binding protein alpha-3 subunit [Gilbertella persicaria]